MRVFVTGATGWIGSAAVDELLVAGHDVTGLARSDASAAALQAKGWLDENGNIPGAKTPAQGAATSVWAAVGAELAGIGGRYLEDGAEALPYSADRPHGGVRAHALAPDTARRLWALSEQLTGLPVSA